MSGGAKNYLDLIVRHEVFRARPYCDRCGVNIVRLNNGWTCACPPRGQAPGAMTIGCGLNLEARGITVEEAREIAGNVAHLRRIELAPFRWFSDLDAVRQAAILDLAYNVGFDGLLRFREMIAALSHADWQAAAACMRESRAMKQEPRRIEELATMLDTGAWPEGDF